MINKEDIETKEVIKIGAYDEERNAVYCGNLRGKDLWVNISEPVKTMTWEEAMDYAEEQGGYLPSIDELTMLYLNKDVINEVIKKHDGDIINGWYWSSSEYSSDYYWYLNMNNGYRYTNDKGTDDYVRVFQL